MRFLWIYAIAYLVFLYLPVVLLPLFAFNDGTIIAFPLKGFTLDWFRELTRVEALRAALKNSLFIAAVTAIMSTSLGLLAARAAQMSFPAKGTILGLVMLPLVLPEIIIAVALLVVIVKILGLDLSSWTVIAAHTLISMPFSVAILRGAFQNLDPNLEEAARDLGETALSAFVFVSVPLIAPGLLASLLITFTISLDEFIIAFFLTGNEPTLPVYIWGLLRFPARLPVVMALGTLLVVASIALVSVAEIARRRSLRRSGQRDSGGFL